jgi:S1-C subfamily serine protease
VDGRTVRSPDDVAQAISADKPGDTVQVELTDGAQDRTVDVQLSKRP